MPGKSGQLPRVGIAFALVAVVGYVALGWRFGGDTDPAAVAIALVAVALAVGSTLRDRL
ncbi:hypothetical protein [Halobacterium litoreum]|uniref:PEP-CTERM protein-sorting domain-containing protein n=1 Tax=Halobacterium litoreum TaxID=2039234 RepID=A0ABD5NDC4_9EURY|nr:hypothetical protein [Halobacterium litoreum]UHH13993.1 hypothetical protein LT972_03095 [Halobacterium litoreum]